jgi:hypothetical protein
MSQMRRLNVEDCEENVIFVTTDKDEEFKIIGGNESIEEGFLSANCVFCQLNEAEEELCREYALIKNIQVGRPMNGIIIKKDSNGILQNTKIETGKVVEIETF